jgi:hypothetical protein
MNEEYKNTEQTPVQETPQEETPAVSQEAIPTPKQEEVPTIPQEATQNTQQGGTSEENAFGPLIGVAIIIIVLIAGGIYFWSTTIDQEESPTVQSTIEADKIVSQLNSQGTSDEIADIEADLNITDLDNLDSELDDLLNEL